jgi:hypothetical protein
MALSRYLYLILTDDVQKDVQHGGGEFNIATV